MVMDAVQDFIEGLGDTVQILERQFTIIQLPVGKDLIDQVLNQSLDARRRLRLPQQRNAQPLGPLQGRASGYLNWGSTSIRSPLVRRFVSFASPTTAISSISMASLMPFLRAAAVCE